MTDTNSAQYHCKRGQINWCAFTNTQKTAYPTGTGGSFSGGKAAGRQT